MPKPDNPYRKGSLIWSVMEGDREDLTAAQIAEVLKAKPKPVHEAMSRIKKQTGYRVPHTPSGARWMAREEARCDT